MGVPRRPDLGAMLETPAALFALEEILDLADFVSIVGNRHCTAPGLQIQ